MSETESSPSVLLLPISPSSESSLSADSAPHSEPTSDEQPDLGAFTAVLREWTHLQPPPRIPVQIRSATSSTTPTFQPDQSLAGSDYNVGRGRRRNSRTSNRSGLSTLSSFTRPASSSVQPEGSTVWNQALIASYLNSSTPSNDMITEEGEESDDLREGEYTPSPPASRASTALTVEIASEVDFPSFDGSRDSSRNQLDSSPYPDDVDPEVSLPVLLVTDGQRLDSRETAHLDEGSEEQDTSIASRDFLRLDVAYSEASSLHSHSRYQSQTEQTSIQLQSQAPPPTTMATSSSESSSLPIQVATSSAFLPSTSSVPQRLSVHSNNGSGSANSTASTATLITGLIQRNRNPLPPRTISDSSVVTADSALSSNFSLVSYQIPETPSFTNDNDEDRPNYSTIREHSISLSELDHHTTATNQFAASNTSLPSTSADSGTLSLKTQKSLDSTTSSISHANLAPAFAEEARPSLAPPFSLSGAYNVSLSSNASPLPNPYSPAPPQSDIPVETLLADKTRNRQAIGNLGIVNDLGTPSEYLSESEYHESLVRSRPMRIDVLPVDDIEEDEVTSELAHGKHLLTQTRAAQPSLGESTVNHDADLPSARGRSGPRQITSERILHIEPQVEVDDDEDGEDYPYQYPGSHTPGSLSQAITPRGLPSHASLTNQNTFIRAYTLQRQVERYNQSFSGRHAQSESSLQSHSDVQQKLDDQHLSQPPIQSYSQSSQPLNQATSRAALQAQLLSQAQSTTQLHPQHSHSFSYPFTPGRSFENQSNPSARNASDSQTTQDNIEKHGYPHSLLGLHALPASFISPDPEDLPILDANTFSFGSRLAQPLIETDSRGESAIRAEDIPDQPLPSLGYLDEALSFIAAERARWRAARQSAAGAVSDSQVVEDMGSDDEMEAPEGQVEISQVIDNEQDHPKRKRRRKRPPRSHGLTPGSAIVDLPQESSKAPDLPADNVSARIAAGLSPKKKRRSKSASATTSTRSLLLDSPNKNKAKARISDKEFLVAPHATPVKGGPFTKILRRPTGADITDQDDLKKPTYSAGGAAGITVDGSTEGSSIDLVGKKGRRVGRREREKEKKKRDAEKELANKRVEPAPAEDFDIGIEYEDDDNEDEGVEPQDEEEDQGENDSLSNMALLQPPRRSRDRNRRGEGRDPHDHLLVGVGDTSTYKNHTPLTLVKADFDSGGVIGVVDSDRRSEIKEEPKTVPEDDVFVSKPNEATPGEKKKRVRTKRTKSLAHAKSDLQLRLDNDGVTLGEDTVESTSSPSKKGNDKAVIENTTDSSEKTPASKISNASSSSAFSTPRSSAAAPMFPPESKRGRLLALAKKLSQLFPEQKEELGRIITRIEKQGAASVTKDKKILITDVAANHVTVKSSPVPIPGMKRGRLKKGSHYRTGSEGTVVGLDFDELGEDVVAARTENFQRSGLETEEEEEIDPRGRPPRKNDVLIHVFVDHSNILIGFLSYLKRHPSPRKVAANTAARGRPLPAIVTKATTPSNGTDKLDPAAAFAAVKPTTTRPLPVPILTETSAPTTSIAVDRPLIPLPSFATMSRSLPTNSFIGLLTSAKNPKGQREERGANSDGQGYTSVEHDDDDAERPGSLFVGSFTNKDKKPLKHLWHAALTLILERGRPVTRRVVVTSSPLYQPMESIERLGYELRVFIRVPDLGDGMDRERYRDKDRGGSGRSNGGGKSNQSSPVTTTLSTLVGSAKRARSIGHVRHLSGNTSAESGSGGAGSGNASGGGGSHQSQAVAATNGTPQKVKYREQGVDELLQLKLHQALAATDDVPEGSTIVLATGDGNMGQFNEEGFLGPVRTALKRGWRVELYAWEDGLSRAWRREFGTGSEWGRRGMFRIIGMEQFASGLVEASGWES